MKKLFQNLGYIATVAALLVGASLLAQSNAASTSRQSTGALDSIDTATLALKVQVDDQLQVILYDGATVFTDHGTKIELANLQRGDKLKIDWIQRDNKKIAVRVEVVERTPAMPGGAAS